MITILVQLWSWEKKIKKNNIYIYFEQTKYSEYFLPLENLIIRGKLFWILYTYIHEMGMAKLAWAVIFFWTPISELLIRYWSLHMHISCLHTYMYTNLCCLPIFIIGMYFVIPNCNLILLINRSTIVISWRDLYLRGFHAWASILHTCLHNPCKIFVLKYMYTYKYKYGWLTLSL